MNKITSFGDAAKVKMEQMQQVGVLAPELLGSGKDILEAALEVTANIAGLITVAATGVILAISEGVESLSIAVAGLAKEISELLDQLKELNEICKPDRTSKKLNKIQKLVNRVNDVADAASDILGECNKIVLLFVEIVESGGGDLVSQLKGIKESFKSLKDSTVSMKNAITGKSDNEGEDEEQAEKKKEKEEKKKESKKKDDKPVNEEKTKELKMLPIEPKSNSTEYILGAEKSINDDDEDDESCWSKIKSCFCCCCDSD